MPHSCALTSEALRVKNLKVTKLARRKLLLVSIVCFLFMLAEIFGGYLAHSLAIMTDAAHMFSDVAGFMISYIAIYLGEKPATFRMSYGFVRAEILGALASIILIWGLLIWLFIEAI